MNENEILIPNLRTISQYYRVVSQRQSQYDNSTADDSNIQVISV